MAKLTSAFYIEYKHLNVEYKFKTDLYCEINNCKTDAYYKVKVTSEMNDKLPIQMTNDIKNQTFKNVEEIVSFFEERHSRYIKAKIVTSEMYLLYDTVSVSVNTGFVTKQLEVKLIPEYLVVKKSDLEDGGVMLNVLDKNVHLKNEDVRCQGHWYRSDNYCLNENSFHSQILKIILSNGDDQFSVIMCDEIFVEDMLKKFRSISNQVTLNLQNAMEQFEELISKESLDTIIQNEFNALMFKKY